MSVAERDKYTGQLTTGHDWNGIKELNSGVPRIIILCLIGTFCFAIGYWYLMPSWPLGDRFYPGKLGIDQQVTFQEQATKAREQNQGWIDEVNESEFTDILYNDTLMAQVSKSGARLFGDNCSMCNGKNGIGNENFPSLADEHWLWGDNPEHVYETIRVGINSDHPDTRLSPMPAFGDSGELDAKAISDVVYFVRSQAKLPIVQRFVDNKRMKMGKSTYGNVCAGCHSVDMKGNQMLGTPNLIDRYWLYGSSEQNLTETIQSGRQGRMPSWESRLEPYERKILALYVTTLD